MQYCFSQIKNFIKLSPSRVSNHFWWHAAATSAGNRDSHCSALISSRVTSSGLQPLRKQISPVLPARVAGAVFFSSYAFTASDARGAGRAPRCGGGGAELGRPGRSRGRRREPIHRESSRRFPPALGRAPTGAGSWGRPRGPVPGSCSSPWGSFSLFQERLSAVGVRPQGYSLARGREGCLRGGSASGPSPPVHVGGHL